MLAKTILAIFNDDSSTPSKADRITGLLNAFYTVDINMDLVRAGLFVDFGQFRDGVRSSTATNYEALLTLINGFVSDDMTLPAYQNFPFTFEKLQASLNLALYYEEAHGNKQIRDYCSSLVTRLQSVVDNPDYEFLRGTMPKQGAAAREVKTKNSKTITTFFLPVDEEYQACFDAWMTYLKKEKLFGPDDPLFPPSMVKAIDGEFKAAGFKREIYKNANAIRQAIKEAFTRADLPPFTPHAFRKTLVKWADTYYPTREAFKAFSQNIGHTNVITTISAYCPVSIERQAELIKKRKKD